MSLSVSRLSKSFGSQQVLDEVSFEAKAGRILGFLGPNGAGKSTMMKIITGYLSAEGGSVELMGIDALAQPKKVSSLIGYLPEKNPLYSDMYVKEFLTFAGGLYGLSGKDLQSRRNEMLEKTGLLPEQHKKIGQLSKGYQQRVGLAKALIHDPKVLILDEPTTGLDPNQLAEIRQLIREIGKAKTLIISTHIMQEVEAICDDVVIIAKGKIKAADSLQNFQLAGSGQQLIVETEESLDLGWFEGFEDVTFGPKGNKQVVISTADAAKARKTVLNIIQQRELNLLSLNQGKKSLEDLFRQFTQ
ncbi:gliding motility-associated ABC transporter ATP-binding subunit GldA [Algoriphagus marincola]|uniref:Gliding motility-associated ABC transporter ATP-binding subunit GldA n=1 Tax=Algoriphagus marincola TaxID=264027 RepID=A0ABS7N4C9_9BACT|nr:gliding motility-associated ABC transporter ATP-binding subunit GldA [Algoriphagus marincola]MBY5951181.1 gliding motility-associated ABC transporter ATP-binding subunit GldA [Algoriphagus marincola]